jgi:hypothetical protein
MKTFAYAGTARDTDGTAVFRATNRDGYAKILAKEGKTDINIMSLPHPMTKADAAVYIADATKVEAMREKFFKKTPVAEAIVEAPVAEAEPA